MRIPTRSAPRPPVNSTAQRNAVWNSTKSFQWPTMSDLFGSTLMPQPIQKRKPPPRPPPPKFNQNYIHSQKERPKKPARPTELLTNFFGRRKHDNQNVIQFSTQVPNTVSQSASTNGSVCLIDLSPPGSPTFTTRSSSDGVSIDSFGSDGNSNPSAFTSSGNTSQTESAFEDDFDFFGISSKKLSQNDPWQVKPMLDPFGPLEPNNQNTLQNVKHVGEASFFAFNTTNHTDNQVPFSQASSKVVHSMPTIIRAKPPKPPAPKVLQKKLEQQINHAETGFKFQSTSTVPFNEPVTLDLTSSWTNNFKHNPSPPMPSIPPPAPPSEYLAGANNDLLTSIKEPHGIALYDFAFTHPDDLPFKEGDVILLIRKINDEWIEGRIGNRQGMFPSNFIDVKIPLPGIPDNVVTAIYPFTAETAEDLTFEEGAKIKVLSRISQDWLYGECDSKKGQFPVNYVNRVPHNIPTSF